MDADLQKLLDMTTLCKIEDSDCNILYENYGSKRYPNVPRSQRNHLIDGDSDKQADLEEIRKSFSKKIECFHNTWCKDEQDYYFLLDNFSFFHLSFQQLRLNEIRSQNSCPDWEKMSHFNELTGISLYAMYYHGKKSIKLLKKIGLLNEQHPEWIFCKRFSKTRDKLIEHNFNPEGLPFQIDPRIFSLVSTDSLLEVWIHTRSQQRAYVAYVDHYEDYYRLEKIMTDIIEAF